MAAQAASWPIGICGPARSAVGSNRGSIKPRPRVHGRARLRTPDKMATHPTPREPTRTAHPHAHTHMHGSQHTARNGAVERTDDRVVDLGRVLLRLVRRLDGVLHHPPEQPAQEPIWLWQVVIQLLRIVADLGRQVARPEVHGEHALLRPVRRAGGPA